MYALGIDLGTTFTAAAAWRAGHAEVVSLGSRTSAIPSVVLLREDETILTGEAASRRGTSEPQRVAREFKRRLGDTTPILLAGAPYSAEALMSRLLRWVFDEVAAREGGPPSAICVCHPANWGPYKRDLLGQAVRLANIEQPVSYLSEPEAAAVFYARQHRVDADAVVAVYDLGGGTFDAAVLRKTATGFEILGQPEGIERLGGIDFDAAVFNHVREALGDRLDTLDPEDPATLAAVARLREECVAAKEALSSDTDASIPVLLPNLATEVRLTRAELEAMVRPALHTSIEAMRRALRSARVTAEQLHSVLLVGGSSRMPLVAQLVGAELGRPVVVDAHPKHAIALGAAWQASIAMTSPGPGTTRPTGTVPVAFGSDRTTRRIAPGSRPVAVAGTVGVPAASALPTTRTPRATATVPAVPARADRGDAHAPPPAPGAGASDGTRRRNLLIGVGALVVALAISGTAFAVTGDRGSDGGSAGAGPGVAESLRPSAAAQSPAGNGGTGETDRTGETTSAPPPPPPDERCTDAIMANDRWVCLTSATLTDGELVIEYEADWAGGAASVGGGYHLHLYGGDGNSPPAGTMGSHAASPGSWQVEDRGSPLSYAAGHQFVALVGDQPKVCARIADGNHALVPDNGGGYGTGNCISVKRN